MIIKNVKKKGVFFTFTAIILATIILFFFSVESNYRLTDKMQVISTRVTTLNSFFNDIERDLSRGLYISGFRSLLAIGEYISTNGVFIDDANKRFNEAMVNGTVDNSVIPVLVNQSFSAWTNKIMLKANKVGMLANISIVNITISHSDPWTVYVLAYVRIKLDDVRGTARFSKIGNISSSISIVGFEDPFYTISSNGRVFNTITITDVQDFANINQLRRHLNLSLYKESTYAPDFLMRLAGNFSNSTFGIESLVNVNEFVLQGLPDKIRSNIDYIYFGNQSPAICQVNETKDDISFNWFRLDLASLGNYSAHCA